MMFILGFISGIFCMFLGAYVYAKRRPRKVAESMMKFELQNEEQNNIRFKAKLKKQFIDGK